MELQQIRPFDRVHKVHWYQNRFPDLSLIIFLILLIATKGFSTFKQPPTQPLVQVRNTI